MSQQQDYRSDIDNWADMYEKAQKDGVFKDVKAHVPSSQTSTNSFFGLHNTNPDTVSDVDSKYWKDVSDLSNVNSFQPDVFQEVIMTKQDVANKAQSMFSSPNPIRQSSVGMDQAMEPESLGVTYTDDDLKMLTDLKQKLYDLESKMAEFETKDQNGKKYEGQIASVKKKINELSDALTKGFDISQQGD